MKLSNIRFSVKLAAVFSVLVVFTLGMGIAAWVLIGRVYDSTQDLATNWLPSIRVLGDIRGATNQLRRAESEHLLSTDTANKDRIEGDLKSIHANIDRYVREYEPMVTPGAETQGYEDFKSLRAAYDAQLDRLLALSRAGASSTAAAEALYRGDSSKALEAMVASINSLIKINIEGADRAYVKGQENHALAREAVVILLVVALLVSAALAYWMTRQITVPLNDAVLALRRVAEGDLSSARKVDGLDETSQLLNTLAEMQERLADVVARVRRGSEQVATASSEIAQGNTDLSARTESQASALEETAASMEELGSAVRHNADNARAANQVAQSASDVARRGGEVVGQVVGTMKEINQSSQRIAEIIGVIDGIAFQTNILALNAAVEAARAGEQGRGFAVVAGEVRSLAQRSAEAAKEIKALISDSVERVGRGSALVDEAGSTMDELVTGVRRVVDLMSEISAASAEQSAGVNQVGEAVTQMDQATQQNAALVEQMAAAASSLRTQAEDLVHTVSVFRLRGDTGARGMTGSTAMLGLTS